MATERDQLYHEAYYTMRSFLNSLNYMAPDIREERYRKLMAYIETTDKELARIEEDGNGESRS